FLRANNMPIPTEFKPADGGAGRERRVLVVEDEKTMANAIERVLRQADFEVCVAGDGFTAGAQFSLFEPAVVTLDLQIPGMGGMDVLRFVRETERLADIKILVVSAMPQQQLEAALKAGADGYLPKPFDNAELLVRVSELAGVNQQG
ncbi:MAG: response regulator transcription factor, partial [Gemmatimonadetes bacterium]|nr:response regulator transcription factor [Gemmatimonadota bacterium]